MSQPPPNRRHRVVFVTPSFAGGGAERVVVTFANELDPQRFQVAIVALSSDGPLRALVADHVRLIVLDRPRVRHGLPRLLSLLRRLSLDVIVSSAPHINHPLLAARNLLDRRTRIVVREASLTSKALPFSSFPRTFAWGLSHLYPRADAVIATSSRMRDELESFGVPAERIAVVANPVDVGRIREFAARPRRRPGEGRRFLAVGRLVPQKGFDRLIPIVQGLPDGDHLTILGDGPERSRLEEMIKSAQMSDRVDLVGFVANPWAWMAGADVLVVPSRTEGLPNAVLEALACGTVIIATPECGAIGDIAEAAEPGAVQIVPIERFALAMSDVVKREVLASRTLLPACFGKEAATAALTEALLAATSGAPDRRQPGAPHRPTVKLGRRSMHLRRFLSLLGRSVRALIAPSSNEHDAFAILSRVARYLVPRYRLPSPDVDWLDDQSFLDYQRMLSVGPASAHRHLTLRNLMRLVRDVEGDTAECGVYRGASSSLILAANERDAPNRMHHIFDSFEGLSTPDAEDGSYWSAGDLSASTEQVRRNLGDRRYRLYPGWIPDRFSEVEGEVFCFVHIDVDLYQPTLDALNFFYPRLSVGGVIVCDDYGSSRCPGATRACDEFADAQRLPGFVGLPAGGGFIIRP